MVGLFECIERSVSLAGPYEHVKRAISHHIIGAALKSIISFDNVYTDSRTNLMIAIESGRGKREIERTIRLFADETQLRFDKPASRHPEQLIGQVRSIKNDDGEWVPRLEPGYLDLDLLSLNEGYGEVNDPTQRPFRAVLSTALDPIGHNEIVKKRLKDKQALRYIPHVSVSIMLQPQPIFGDVWYSGFPRRFLWVIMPDLDDDERRKIREATRTMFRGALDDDTLLRMRQFLAWTDVRHPEYRRGAEPPLAFGFDLQGNAPFKEALRDRWEALVDVAEASDKSLRTGGLTRTIEFDLRDHLVKMTCHHAFARVFDAVGMSPRTQQYYHHIAPTPEDVEAAYVDLRRFTADMVGFLSIWVQANLNLARLAPRGQKIVIALAKWGPQTLEQLRTNLSLAYNEDLTAVQLSTELMILEALSYVRHNMDGTWQGGW